MTEAIDKQQSHQRAGRDKEDSRGGARGHQALLAKQQHMERVKEAWKISSDHKFGESFDIDL